MKKLYFLLVLLSVSACQNGFMRQPMHVASVSTQAIPIDASTDSIRDSVYSASLQPLHDALEREMAVEIGYAPEPLWLAEPESPMLNWATETLLDAARKVYPGHVDVAIVNIGGLRCEWPKGPITRRSVYELMPFDNKLVVLTLSGADIMDLCQSFATYMAQGVAGMRMIAVDGQLAEVTIAGQPVDPEKQYTLATSDYLAGGMDNMAALTRHTDYWTNDRNIRDIYLEAVQQQDTVRASLDGRMQKL